MKKAFAVFTVLLFLSLALPVAAQEGVPGVAAEQATKGGKNAYIVRMALDPTITYDGSIQALPATKPGKGQKINPNSAHVKQYTKFLEKSHDKALQDAGVSTENKLYDYQYALNGFAVLLTPAEAADVAKQPGVVSVLQAELRFPQTDASPTFLGLDAPGGPWLTGFDGRGVVVGVIDTGIWPEHASFADDGSYASPPSAGLPCEFGNTAWNPNDAPFACNNKLIGAQAFLDLQGADRPATCRVRLGPRR
jgi:subtilisin family serine protease